MDVCGRGVGDLMASNISEHAKRNVIWQEDTTKRKRDTRDTMRVPETISIQLQCQDAVDLSGIICEIEIAAGSKNLYYIVFPKTDQNGRSSLSADDVKGQFEDHWEQGLMDYNGTLDSASPMVAVRLHNRKQAASAEKTLRAWPLLKGQISKWRSRAEQVDYLLSSRNDLFHMRLIYWNLEKEPAKNIQIRALECP